MAAGASARSEVITQSGVSRAECTSRLLPGMRSARSSTTRTGERASMPGRRQVEQRIVRQHRADADQDGVALRAQQMHPRPRRLARDRDRLAAGRADLVVGGDRELQDHMRALDPGCGGNARHGRARLPPRTEPDIDRDAGGAQAVHGPARRLPDWDPRSPTPRAQCRRRSRRRRRAATCRNASTAPASHRAWRRARPRRRAAALRARHAGGRPAGSSRGRQ